MLSTAQVSKIIENNAVMDDTTVSGSIEAGEVHITYTRPNGSELGCGFQSRQIHYTKGSRKWTVSSHRG